MTGTFTTTPNVADLQKRLPEMLDDLEALVACESPSLDHSAVARCAEVVAGLGRRLLGVGPERIVVDGYTHLRWRFGTHPRVLLLGHHDTVWPLGSLAAHPWSVTDGTVRGPGCFDMKAGIVQLLHALAALRDPAGVTVVVTGDEELGSPTSRTLIEDEARRCAAVFVLEASADGGALKTQRKGTSLYRLEVTGRAAHAGLEPERGANAAVELAQQVTAVAELGDPSRGTTVTPTVVSAGTTVNTVPAVACLAVDVRVASLEEQERVDQAINALTPRTPGTSLQIVGGPNRPPLESAASAVLFKRARQLADDLGLEELRGVAVGGGSDGNLTAGLGTPTLDGLGAVGGGAHADDEHVVAAEMPRRAALLARLIEDVRRRPPSSARGTAVQHGGKETGQ